PVPWTTTMPPHSRSSRLSRFGSVHATSASDNPPTAQMIHQARCKITEKKISSPVAAQVSSDSSCLAVLAMVRRQELKYPVLHYYRLEEDANPVYAAGVTIFTELSDIAYHMTTDEERKLLFVSDGTRVKSFRWDTDITISRHEESTGAAVHTMRCDRYEGAIEMLPNGYLVRAGRGEAAIWDLDTLKTHEGGRRIGTGRFVEYGPFDEERTGPWGKSTGSHPTSTVNFEEKTLYPWVFHYHRPAAKLLAAETQNGSGRHGYVSLDLEHGGRAAVQYTGHAGDVHAISSSAGDPNTFAIACADSYARVYDLRDPQPVIKIASEGKGEACPDVIYIHPDGIPTTVFTLFTGSDAAHCVKLWDLRARAVVYDVSTGNTSV
ncbi:hypothetical protein C8Q80DRAFT_1061991, partial [Daedaleopsis nitida]